MKKQKSKIERLLDSNDKSINASTVIFLIGMTISIILLLVPVICLLTEVFTQGAVTSDLSGWASYIGASTAAAGIGGGVKGISVYTHNRYNVRDEYCEEEEVE